MAADLDPGDFSLLLAVLSRGIWQHADSAGLGSRDGDVDLTALFVVKSANRMQSVARDLAVDSLAASVLVTKRVQMTSRT